MSACLAESVFNGLGNGISLKLYTDNSVLDHTLITRVVVHINDTAGTTIDSDSEPGLFDWDSAEQLTLRLGLATNALPEGPVSAYLVVYTTSHPNGLRWEDELQLNVEDA